MRCNMKYAMILQTHTSPNAYYRPGEFTPTTHLSCKYSYKINKKSLYAGTEDLFAYAVNILWKRNDQPAICKPAINMAETSRNFRQRGTILEGALQYRMATNSVVGAVNRVNQNMSMGNNASARAISS